MDDNWLYISAIINALVGFLELGAGVVLLIKFKKQATGILLFLGFMLLGLNSFFNTVVQILKTRDFSLYGIPTIIGFILILIGVILMPFWKRTSNRLSSDNEVSTSYVNIPYPAVWAGIIIGCSLLIIEIATIIGYFTNKRGVASSNGLSTIIILSLSAFIFYYMCLYRIHKILAKATDGKHPVSPGMAVGFHFIPFYNLYWMFKWTNEIVRFIKKRKPASKLPIGLMGVLLLLGTMGATPPIRLEYGYFMLGHSYYWLMWFAVLWILTFQLEKVVVYSSEPIENQTPSTTEETTQEETTQGEQS